MNARKLLLPVAALVLSSCDRTGAPATMASAERLTDLLTERIRGLGAAEVTHPTGGGGSRNYSGYFEIVIASKDFAPEALYDTAISVVDAWGRLGDFSSI